MLVSKLNPPDQLGLSFLKETPLRPASLSESEVPLSIHYISQLVHWSCRTTQVVLAGEVLTLCNSVCAITSTIDFVLTSSDTAARHKKTRTDVF